MRQRLAQVEFEDAARLDGLRHLVAEEAEGAAAVGLGAIQRHVGVLEQRVGGNAARGHGDADAGADFDQMIVDLVALAQAIDDAAGEACGIFAGMDVLLEHDEFVAAEAGDKILGPQHFAQAVGDRAQQLVAAGMAERVVDLLELVEVDEQQRRQLIGALLGGKQAADLVAEIDPVGQRGEFVVARQMADARFGVAPLGDVFQEHDGAAAGHRLERPRQRTAAHRIGIGGDHVAGLGILDFGEDHLAAGSRDRAGENAGVDDVGGTGAALDEIVGQLHHLAEAVIHHREPAVGAEHAQPVRHVVERGVELAGQRRLAKARGQRLDEDRVQAEVDVLQADEEQPEQPGKAEVIETAMQRQRQRHRSARQQDVFLDDLRMAVIARGAAAGVADGHGDAEHVRDGVVAAEDGDEAPGAEHGGIGERPDRIARLQDLACSKLRGEVRRSYLRIWKARIVPMPTIRNAIGHSSTLPVLTAVMTAATAAQTPPRNIGQKFWHMESISAA